MKFSTEVIGEDSRTRPAASQVMTRLESWLGVPFTSGNSVKVLRNGIEIFPEMLKAVNRSKHLIEFLTFVYWQGNVAEEFANALSQRAREGVEVRVLLDAIGAQAMHEKLVRQMQAAGVDVQWFRPPRLRTFWRLNFRTHRKILVCDRQIGFTGGVGIAEEWEGDARNSSEWRDTHFRIEGVAVRGLVSAFLENWIQTTSFPSSAVETLHEPTEPGSAAIQSIRVSPAAGWSDAATLLRLVTELARERLRITTAYFVPDNETIELLGQASRRGVHIEILLPGPHSDSRLSKLAGQSCYRKLIKAGISIHHYQPTMMHAKLITIDGCLASIGSANFDCRAMYRNHEVVLNVCDEQVVKQLDDHFDTDVESSTTLNLNDVARRGLIPRIGEFWTGFIRREL